MGAVALVVTALVLLSGSSADPQHRWEQHDKVALRLPGRDRTPADQRRGASCWFSGGECSTLTDTQCRVLCELYYALGECAVCTSTELVTDCDAFTCANWGWGGDYCAEGDQAWAGGRDAGASVQAITCDASGAITKL